MGFWDFLRGLFRKRDAAAWAADARERLARGKTARALAAAERAVAMAPGQTDLLLLRAEILKALDLQERALEDLLAALDRDPGRAAALVGMLEELEPRAPRPDLVWARTWPVYAARGDLPRAAERLTAIAARGEQVRGQLRAQCEAMVQGTGERRVAHLGLAVLARESGDATGSVDRILEAARDGRAEDLAFADNFLQDLLGRRPGLREAVRALARIRVLRGETEEARDLVTWVLRRDPVAAGDLLESLREGETTVATFALGLLEDLERDARVTPRMALLLARGLLEDRRGAEAASVILRALARDGSAAAEFLPVLTQVMRREGGLPAREAHARAASLAGDPESALITVEEFLDEDPARALAVLETLPATVRNQGEGALLLARARAGLGDHPRAIADLRRWCLAAGAVASDVSLPHVRAAAEAWPGEPGYAFLLHDLLVAGGEHAAAGEVLRDLVARLPVEGERVAARAEALLATAPDCFPALLASARAGMAMGTDAAAVLAPLRHALEVRPEREPEVLAEVTAAERWVAGNQALEIFRAELILRAGRLDEGLDLLEDIVVANPSRGPEALTVLRAVQGGAGAGDPRPLLAEHRVRRALKDYEGAVAPLRRVADLSAGLRTRVLSLLDEILAESANCRGAHRQGVEIAIRLGHGAAPVLERLSALLEIPTPPRDTEFVTRRATAVQARTPTVAGHRLLARCHVHAARWPLATEEARRMVAADPAMRGEAAAVLAHVLGRAPTMLEARILLASLHASLGAVDAAREVLVDAVPRTDAVITAMRDLVAAYPEHAGARLDLVDAFIKERRLDDALEAAGRVLAFQDPPLEELRERILHTLELAPEYGPALYVLADIHHRSREWEREIAACDRVLRIAPREAETVLGRLDRILEADPRCLEAALAVVRLHRLHRKADRVASEGKRALEIARDPAEISRVAEALADLELDLDPHVEFREVLAEALVRAGRAADAVGGARRLLHLDSGRAPVVARLAERLSGEEGQTGIEALRLLHDAHLARGRAADATAAAAALLERDPERVAEVRERFAAALQADPACSAAAEGVASTAVLMEDAVGAVDAHLHNLRRHPELRRETGRALAALKDRFPASAAPSLALAEYVHLPLDLLEDAAADLETALERAPARHVQVLSLAAIILERDARSPLGHRARGRAQVAAEDPDGAVATFRDLAALHPRHRKDALAGLDAALRVQPDHAEGQYRRAEILLSLDRAAEAEEQAAALATALRSDSPWHFRAHMLLAGTREALGDFPGALDALRAAAMAHPDEPAVYPRIRANRAARLRARAAALSAAPASARPAADLDRGETLLDAGDPRGALTGVGPPPADPEALARWRVLRARAFLVLGSAPGALAELEEAFGVKGVEKGGTPTGRDALLVAGIAHLRAGETVKAIRRFEMLARVDPAHGRVREILDRLYEEDRRGGDHALEVTSDLEALPAAAGTEERHG